MKLYVLLVVALPLFFLASVLPSRAETSNPALSPVVKQGGLLCFTLTPGHDSQHQTKESPSCNTLCNGQGAACTGVTSSISPPVSCESGSVMGTCRCCKIAAP